MSASIKPPAKVNRAIYTSAIFKSVNVVTIIQLLMENKAHYTKKKCKETHDDKS